MNLPILDPRKTEDGKKIRLTDLVLDAITHFAAISFLNIQYASRTR